MADLPRLGDNHRDWLDDDLDSGKNVKKEMNKKRRKTAVIIEIKNRLVRNVILPLPQLVYFLMNNLQCCRCCYLSAVPTIKEVETFGFATETNYLREWGHHSSIRPDLLDSSKEKLDKMDSKLKPGEALSSNTKATDFELN
jgi:hypothetical protein